MSADGSSETAAADRMSETAPEIRRVMVTGGSGFVGGYVVRELITRGYEPVCLVRDRGKMEGRLPEEQRSKVRTVVGDIFDLEAVDQAAAGCQAAIHLIGIIEEKPLLRQTFQRMHVEATQIVLDACARAGVFRYLHMSALGTRPDAISTYHQTKWIAEEHVRQSPLAWTIFRPSMIHGPDGEFMQMMKFFATSKVRMPVMPYFGSGNNLIQPISVRDVATIFVKSLSMPETTGQVYELGGPERLNWREFYDASALAITGHTRMKVPVPVPVAKLVARAVMPLLPSLLVPYKFNVPQVQMSQEDSVCPTEPIERTFGLKLRDFRTELPQYADQIE